MFIHFVSIHLYLKFYLCMYYSTKRLIFWKIKKELIFHKCKPIHYIGLPNIQLPHSGWHSLITRPLFKKNQLCVCFWPTYSLYSNYLSHAPDIAAVGTVSNVFSYDGMSGRDSKLSSARRWEDALRVEPKQIFKPTTFKIIFKSEAFL